MTRALSFFISVLMTTNLCLAEKKPFPPKKPKTAPEQYTVVFKTTKGDFKVDVNRSWAPKGADRFYNLVKMGYFKDIAFFRAIKGFMVQFGIHGDPNVSAKWRQEKIDDDPQGAQSNKKGTITFATAGPNTRTTQLFINLVDNGRLDRMGFTPFGTVTEGMEKVVSQIYTGYGEGAPGGSGPNQGRIQSQGNQYLKKEFSKLDFITSASILKESSKKTSKKTQP